MAENSGAGGLGRFFDVVAVVRSKPADGGWNIELDGRVVQTPMGNPFSVPSRPLAGGVADEWDAQGDKVIPATMPLTSLANAAIDKIGPDRSLFIDQLVTYARSDLLCYRADEPDDLVARQQGEWQPVIDWGHAELKARFVVTTGIVPVEQSQEALDAIASILDGVTGYQLTGLADLAGRMNSVLLALAVWKRHLDADEAFSAAFLDEIFQEERWGEDSDALTRRSAIQDEITSAARFLTLLDPM